MIDHANEIFHWLSERITSEHSNADVKGEYVETPAKLPCVSVEETENLPVYLDSATNAKYARIRYRVQIFSNRSGGRRAEARAIYKTVDEWMQEHNLICKSMTTTPTVYHASVYQITATYEAIVDANGTIYRT